MLLRSALGAACSQHFLHVYGRAAGHYGDQQGGSDCTGYLSGGIGDGCTVGIQLRRQLIQTQGLNWHQKQCHPDPPAGGHQHEISEAG
ncbi:hypothetical protein D3C76_1515450 [compost metagenome]